MGEPNERFSSSHGRIEAPAVGDAVPRTKVLMVLMRRRGAQVPSPMPTFLIHEMRLSRNHDNDLTLK